MIPSCGWCVAIAIILRDKVGYTFIQAVTWEEYGSMGSIAPLFREQRTVRKEVSFSGIGLHTGEVVTLRFCPAPADSGVVFRRTDLAGHPEVPATIQHVQDTSRNTTIGIDKVSIHTVEHVLAAVAAYSIDNLVIEVDGIEPPVGNGSSDVFVELIEDAGIEEQDASVAIRRLSTPIYHSDGDVHLVALPSETFKVSYTLSYPHSSCLKAQYFTLDVNTESFKREIAPCRSFGLYEEMGPLLQRNLIKGVSLANAVVVHGDAVFSKDGLFFPDEMVRHKILDLIGDLYLVGIPLLAHIVAVKSGHTSHRALSTKLLNSLMMENPDGDQNSG